MKRMYALTESVPAGAEADTEYFCQAPVIYRLTEGKAWIRTTGRNGESSESAGYSLDAGMSLEIFGRTGKISRIDVGIPVDSLHTEE